jgi:drug/metabolite transporter (DMT)-like permease
MYQYILGASLFKSAVPYMRKHVLNTLDSHDLLYLDAFIFFIIVFCVFCYRCIFDRTHMMNTLTNYKQLSYYQMFCVVAISFISVLVVYMVLQMDKFYNTPLINYISRVSLTSICAIIIGVLYFKEKYNFQHLIGILVTIAGIYLMTTNSNLF